MEQTNKQTNTETKPDKILHCIVVSHSPSKAGYGFDSWFLHSSEWEVLFPSCLKDLNNKNRFTQTSQYVTTKMVYVL